MKVAIRSRADASRPFGTFTRPFWLGEELAILGNEVVHFCVSHPAEAELKAKYYRIGPELLSGAWTGMQPTVDNAFRLIEGKPDVLYVHQSTNLGFLAPRFFHLYPTVVDVHGSESLELKAFGHPKRAGRARLLEAAVLRAANCIIAASAELRLFLVEEYNLDPKSVYVVPNGVPSGTVMRPPSPSEEWRRRLGVGVGEFLVLCAAPQPFGANDLATDFLAEVSRLARVQSLPVRFVVTGRSSAPDGILSTGVVQDYIGLIDSSDVTILPYPPSAICGGIRNKCLEFMARGRPVISTTEGIRGLGSANPDVHYIVAETPSESVAALSSLFTDEEKRLSLGRSAKNLAGRFLWSKSAAQLIDALRDTVKNRNR